MSIPRIKVPNRNVDRMSINTANILENVQKQLHPEKFVKIASAMPLEEALGTGLFKEAGGDFYKSSYKNPDYGKIWVKKTVIDEKTGAAQDWLVVYTSDDEDDIIRQVASLSKTAAASVGDPQWIESHLPPDHKSRPEADVIMGLIDAASEEGADVSYTQMERVYKLYLRHNVR